VASEISEKEERCRSTVKPADKKPIDKMHDELRKVKIV
jgi:hypothetical protein